MGSAAMLKKIVPLWLAFAVVAGCAAKQASLGPGTAGTVQVLVRAIEHDDKGLPLIGPALAERPTRQGDHFTIVRLADRRPVISYDVAVTKEKPDFGRPFKAVYEWTGKGFMMGANITGAMVQSNPPVPRDRDAAAVELAIVVSPLAAGAVGGFVVGLADGIRQTALELGKAIGVTHEEQVVTCTTYGYDDAGRLASMRMFTPDRKQEIVREEFEYEGSEAVPSRTVVKSFVEGIEREIKP